MSFLNRDYTPTSGGHICCVFYSELVRHSNRSFSIGETSAQNHTSQWSDRVSHSFSFNYNRMEIFHFSFNCVHLFFVYSEPLTILFKFI